MVGPPDLDALQLKKCGSKKGLRSAWAAPAKGARWAEVRFSPRERISASMVGNVSLLVLRSSKELKPVFTSIDLLVLLPDSGGVASAVSIATNLGKAGIECPGFTKLPPVPVRQAPAGFQDARVVGVRLNVNEDKVEDPAATPAVGAVGLELLPFKP